MSRLGGMMRTTRPKKLTSKQSIQIVRENDVDLTDEDPQLALQTIETGVEKGEESEYHLQAAINASTLGNVKQPYIPTPESTPSTLKYDKLYPPTFSQPSTYIRFSSTVEECGGCPYNLVEEDAVALKILNQKRGSDARCTEDQFEEVMNFFEETAQAKQPYAAVDSPPVVPYEEMEETIDSFLDEDAKRHAKGIYEHWKSRRTKTGNKPLAPDLKSETGQGTDDGDPYVCFRRREVRQVRKTRGRDLQSAEKLRRLRKELEDARQLLGMVRQRELMRKDMLASEREVFTQRTEVKDMKRKLSIKDDDEDLINQKPKKKSVEPPTTARQAAPQLRIPARPTTQLGEDLALLEDVQADKENEIAHEIKQNVAKHAKWNDGYIDMTRAPLTPKPQRTVDAEFRPALTQEYLPTPPPSSSSERDASKDDTVNDVSLQKLSVGIQQAAALSSSSDEEESHRPIPSFRRRVGRGGRVLIDRRCMPFRHREDVDPLMLDRFKYDREDDDDDMLYDNNYDVEIMHHRAYMAAKSRAETAAIQSQLQNNGQGQNGRRLQNGSSPLTSNHNGGNSTPSNAAGRSGQAAS